MGTLNRRRSARANQRRRPQFGFLRHFQTKTDGAQRKAGPTPPAPYPAQARTAPHAPFLLEIGQSRYGACALTDRMQPGATPNRRKSSYRVLGAHGIARLEIKIARPASQFVQNRDLREARQVLEIRQPPAEARTTRSSHNVADVRQGSSPSPAFIGPWPDVSIGQRNRAAETLGQL